MDAESSEEAESSSKRRRYEVKQTLLELYCPKLGLTEKDLQRKDAESSLPEVGIDNISNGAILELPS